jgi:DNA-binding IclR family transcriptional regulator
MFPEMQKVFETGERVTVRKRPGMTSVLAPVRDSLGDVVGLVEVVGRE